MRNNQFIDQLLFKINLCNQNSLKLATGNRDKNNLNKEPELATIIQ